MKKKITHILLAFFLVGFGSTVFAQSYAVNKKSVIVSGTGSFTNAGSNGQRSSHLSLNSTVNYFLIKNLFVGGEVGYVHSSALGQISNGINIGPQIGYAFGNEDSKVFPYVLGGIKYEYDKISTYKVNGSDTFFGVGVLIPVKKHIGITLDAKYHIINSNPVGSSVNANGNIFSVGVGISGLFFK